MPDTQHSEYVAAGDEPKRRIAKRDQEAMSFRHRDLMFDSGLGCVKTCARERHRIVFSIVFSRLLSSAFFAFQIDDVEMKFLSANSISEFSHSLGRKSNAVSEAEAPNHRPWNQLGLVQPAAPTVRVVGPGRTRARVRLVPFR